MVQGRTSKCFQSPHVIQRDRYARLRIPQLQGAVARHLPRHAASVGEVVQVRPLLLHDARGPVAVPLREGHRTIDRERGGRTVAVAPRVLVAARAPVEPPVRPQGEGNDAARDDVDEATALGTVVASGQPRPLDDASLADFLADAALVARQAGAAVRGEVARGPPLPRLALLALLPRLPPKFPLERVAAELPSCGVRSKEESASRSAMFHRRVSSGR